MCNKFLDKYPQLRDPKIGDFIKVINVYNILKEPVPAKSYQIGDIGIITNMTTGFHKEPIYAIDFQSVKEALLFKDEFIIISIPYE